MGEKQTNLLLKLEEFLPEQAPVITTMATMFRPPTYNEAVSSAATPTLLPTPIIPIANPTDEILPTQPPPYSEVVASSATATQLPSPITAIRNPTDQVLSTQPAPTNSISNSDSPSHNDSERISSPVENVLPNRRDCWVIAQNGCVPPNAVQAGYNTDKSRNYVGRAYHKGEFLPGKYIPKDRCTYVVHQGNEVRKSNCEILVGSEFIWVPVTENLALGAVKVDQNSPRQHLYVGRSDSNGCVASGKFQCSDNCLYLSSNGREIQIKNNMEILVRKDEYFRHRNNN